MGKLYWNNYVTGQGLDGCVDFLNELSWNLTVRQEPPKWLLYSGDKILFEAYSEAELESFIQGMAIGLAVLPEDMIAEIKKLASE